MLAALHDDDDDDYIQHYPFICTESNGLKYCYLTLISLFKITPSFARS